LNDKKAQIKFSKNLSEEMSYALVDNLVVNTTSMISTAILMHRRGISSDLLQQRVGFIYDELLARNGLVAPTLKPTP